MSPGGCHPQNCHPRGARAHLFLCSCIKLSGAMPPGPISMKLDGRSRLICIKLCGSMEMGPGGMAPESLMQLHKNKASPSSFIEMGPKSVEPVSLMQLHKNK